MLSRIKYTILFDKIQKSIWIKTSHVVRRKKRLEIRFLGHSFEIWILLSNSSRIWQTFWYITTEPEDLIYFASKEFQTKKFQGQKTCKKLKLKSLYWLSALTIMKNAWEIVTEIKFYACGDARHWSQSGQNLLFIRLQKLLKFTNSPIFKRPKNY